MRTIFLIIITVLLAACQTAPKDAPPFSLAPAAPAGYGTLYLYRLDAPPYTGLIRLSVAGRPVLAAPEQAYTWIHLKAGEYTVLAEWPPQPGWKSVEGKFVVSEGSSTYVRAQAKVSINPAGWLTPGGIGKTSLLTLTPQDQGPTELKSCCRYLAGEFSILK